MQITRDLHLATTWYLYLVTFFLGCKKILKEPHGKLDETPESPSNPPYLNKTRNLHQMFGGYLIFDEAPLKLGLNPIFNNLDLKSRGHHCTLLSALCPLSQVQTMRSACLLDGAVPSKPPLPLPAAGRLQTTDSCFPQITP